jgi:tetratricopeptide (TPR) repeat protein
MCKLRWLLLVVVGVSLAAAEEQQYKRLLKGEDAKKAEALQKRIDELWAAGKFTEALTPAEELLALRKQLQGEGHWEVVDAAQQVQMLRQAARLPAAQQQALAELLPTTVKARELDAQGKYPQAEPLYRKALTVCEEALGPKHPDTARTYNKLAYNLLAQGRAQEAEPLHRKALAVCEKALGLDHPDTGASYSGLAHDLQIQGRAQEAEPLHRKALAVFEEVLGPKDPDTATNYNNLGSNLDAQGRVQEAEPLHRKALAVREEILGPKHPATAQSYNNLASNLQAQGRIQEAEPLHRKALAIYEEVLGLKHPHTAFSYNNLALNLQALGRAQEAEPLFRKALAIYEEVLGSKNPYTATNYNNLATNLDAQGRAKDAEPLYRKALAVREEVLGPKHSATADGYNNLAYNLQAQGRVQDAEPLYRRALAIYEEVLGLKHPDTAQSYNNLAVNLSAQGRAREAELLLRKVLAVWEELGPKLPRAANSYNNLALSLQAQGRVREAEPLYRKALAVREEVLGPKHPHTAQSYNYLAANLQVQGRVTEAEPLWKAAADGIEAARLRLAGSTLDRAKAVSIKPHIGLAACRAGLERPGDAWIAAEAGLARGLLDDLAAHTGLPADPEAERRDRQRAARLDALDRLLTPLLTAAKLADEQRRRRDDLLRERRSLDTEAAQVAAERSRRAVLPLADVQTALAADTALVLWVDDTHAGDHWGCVLRYSGLPAWVRLKGSGPEGAWTDADDTLARLLREDLSHGEPDATRHARRLAAQRLEPLASHLGPTKTLPAVRRLVVVPVGVMAGIPVEVLTDSYQISYAPSGSVFTRLVQRHRRLQEPTLLALGDPNFELPSAAAPAPPTSGLYLSAVLSGSNAARAGLRSGDVLLSYNGSKLTTKADLKITTEGAAVPIQAWRDGKTLTELRLEPGKLGVAISEDAPAVALRKRRELELLADARVRAGLQPLPGTGVEVAALARLLPKERTTLLLGSNASEQQLQALAASGKLKQFRLLHLATHATIDPVSAAHSALELARDRLPGVEEQGRLAAAGQTVPTGRLSVGDIAEHWQLDADLVTLSACQTALGPQGGGEGLLGFSQVLLGKGARSLLLSLWKVDDTATALLMTRFYQNLLGKRDGLEKPLPKAEAVREAKAWLRGLSAEEASRRVASLPAAARGERAKAAALGSSRPYEHPTYWAAFVLFGDPD